MYFNLHKKLYSVQEKVNGTWKVVKHTDQLTLKNVELKVYEKGRKRVLRDKRKNVHAYIIGELVDYNYDHGGQYNNLYYNPYLHDHFVDYDTKENVCKCNQVTLNGKNIVKYN